MKSIRMGSGGQQRHAAPQSHREIAKAGTELPGLAKAKEENAGDRGEADCCGFCQEVAGWEADAEDPVRKVAGGGGVICAGQDGPTAEEVEKNGDAGGIAAEEVCAERDPADENCQWREGHRVGEFLAILCSVFER